MSSAVEQIKARLSIQDVLGTYLKLESAGANLKAKCPFHAENTPSFFVSPARGSYYCFGCNKGGDIFTFVQEIEGQDFIGSLKLLADRAGVQLEARPSGERDTHAILKEIMESATLFYERELAETDEALKYLLNRGLNKDIVKLFRIGYAPDQWKKCFDYLTVKGYKAQDIAAAGLIVEGKSGSSYDRFRQRIMFPIADTTGATIAFTGRILETKQESLTVKDINLQGKYVNSPQTSLYSKSAVLYGYDKAKLAIRKENSAILVEGQMDTIMSHQAGLTNTVAVSGTALTNEHLALIKRLTNNIIMAFDADSAGIKSSRRAVEMALDLDLDIRVAAVTHGKDPADLVKEDPEAWREAVKKSTHVIDYYLSVITRETTDNRELRLQVEKEVIPLISRIKSSIDKAHFVSRIAERISLSESAIWESIRSLGSDKSTMSSTSNKTYAPETKSREDHIVEKIFGILFWQESEPAKAVMDVSTVRQNFALVLGQELVEKEQALHKDRERLMFEAEAQHAGSEEISKEIDHLLASLESEILKKKFQTIVHHLKQKGLPENKANELLQECQTIGARLESLKPTLQSAPRTSPKASVGEK